MEMTLVSPGLVHNALMFFQASDMTAVYNERIAIVLGFLTLISALAVFVSCRTCVAWLRHLGMKDPSTTRGYSVFYRFHLYYWWAFGMLLVVHPIIAILHTGLPQAGDPDANIHWIILGIGLFSAIAAVAVFSSCRVVPRLVTMATSRNPFDNSSFKAFFRNHSYFWAPLVLLVAVHIAVAFNHARIWPGG
jgi:hypothetical protein